MANLNATLIAAMQAAGMQNVQEFGVIDLIVTFDAIHNTAENRAKYAQALGGYVNGQNVIIVPLPNGRACIHLTDDDEDDPIGTVYAAYN